MVGEIKVHVDVRISRLFLARMYAGAAVATFAQWIMGDRAKISIDLLPACRARAQGKRNLEVVIG